jgi:hypothetical protein
MRQILFAGGLAIAGIACLHAAESETQKQTKQGKRERDPFENAFMNPPNESRPRTWWHWISNHVSKEGITKDLEAMKRIGLKGAQITTMPQGGPFGDVKYLSPEWFDAVAHAEKEAKRLGLILGFSNAIGCSGAGGPWITPDLSMQKLVWSETLQKGPFNGNLQLPQPETVEDYYRDLKVFAFPTIPGDELPLSSFNPKITSDIPGLKTNSLVDGNPATGESIRAGEGKQFIQLEFETPKKAAAVQLFLTEGHNVHPAVAITLFSSADGIKWQNICSLHSRTTYSLSETKVLSEGFAEITSRFYKVEFSAPKNHSFTFNELSLGGARLKGANFKAARSSNHPTVFVTTPFAIPAEQTIDTKKIIDLTPHLDVSGKVRCKLPEGNWTIIRFGHTSTGKRMVPDHPTDKNSPGLEADKMSRTAILTHLKKGLVGQVLEQYKKWNSKVPLTINIDSWECGPQTWTADFPREFQKRRGYDGMSWLLTVTGRIVNSVDETERFLWDYRRTIADLYAENFYGTFRAFCHAHDILLDGEAPGIGIPAIADGLQCLGLMDVPQGEFWIEAKPGPDRYLGLGGSDNTKEAAVGSHIYGKTITSCEAFTAFGYADGWQMDPAQLKPIGDRQFCLGMNEIVFHRYVHQPDERVPGMTLGQFGLNFDRTLTWWEQGRDWIQYITRCQHLLRQGLFVADVCYFYGEGAPNSVWYYVPRVLDPRKRMKPILPAGYDYDCCDWTSLNKMVVKEGLVVLPDGMSYAYLVMPENAQFTVHALRKISALAKAGATIVVNAKPFSAPSLTDFPQADRHIQEMANELWPEGPAPAVKKVGKGRVIANDSFESIFKNDNLMLDFETVSGKADADIRYIHRKQGETEIYYVCNQQDRMEEATLNFRVAGKVPEIWHPETGKIARASVYKIEGARTAVTVGFGPSEAFFVVFRHPANATEMVSQGKPPNDSHAIPAPVTIEGPWMVTFQAGRRAPAEAVVFERLSSWTEHPMEGVKYFSGTATYTQSITLGKEFLKPGQRVALDLGAVKNVAELFVNGHAIGVLWKPPFRADITSAIQAGENMIEIRITNLWPNRLIGDQKLPEKERVTWCFYRFYTAESPLLESGLLGPVKIFSCAKTDNK